MLLKLKISCLKSGFSNSERQSETSFSRVLLSCFLNGIVEFHCLLGPERAIYIEICLVSGKEEVFF